MYCNGSRSGDSVIYDIYKQIDNLIGGVFETPAKQFLIGLDESGKGELVGHIILTGVFFPVYISETAFLHFLIKRDTILKSSQIKKLFVH